MIIGGTTDAAVSILLLLGFFIYLSWYNRLRATHFSGGGYDENEEEFERIERCAVIVMVRSTYHLPDYHSYCVLI